MDNTKKIKNSLTNVVNDYKATIENQTFTRSLFRNHNDSDITKTKTFR